MDMPKDQMTRVRTKEREDDCPDSITIVARKGRKTEEMEITKDQFFGTGAYGAPINGDQLLHMIHTLRRIKF